MPTFSTDHIEIVECMRRYANGESMSRENCDELLRRMTVNGTLPDVPTLIRMQEENPRFVPVLDLKSDAAQQSIQLLRDACGRLNFAVRVDDELPVDVAVALHEAMSSPQSTITGFCYHGRHRPQADQLEIAASQEVLEQCITDATALQSISGPGLVLHLIKRPVPELRLFGITWTPGDERALDRVLSMGGVNKLGLLNDDTSNPTYNLLVDAVMKANGLLPPEKCVHEFEVPGSMQIFDPKVLEKLVRTLFTIKHLTKLTLPSPGWLTAVPLPELKELVAGGSLQHLDFSSWKCKFTHEKTYLNELGSTIEQNRKRAMEWALGPARALTLTGTNGSEVVEQLAQYIAEDRQDHLSLSSNELLTISQATEKSFQELKKT